MYSRRYVSKCSGDLRGVNTKLEAGEPERGEGSEDKVPITPLRRPVFQAPC